MGIEVQKRAIDIGIIAKDIDAMKTFYGEVLGLELEGVEVHELLPQISSEAIGESTLGLRLLQR